MKIPDNLAENGRKWAQNIIKAFDFDEHELQAVWMAANCLDRIASAQGEIAVHGAVVENRYHELKTNPAVVIERDNKILFARLCRELNLFDTKIPDSRIPRKV